MENITWQAYERESKNHRPDWYWALGIISASMAITAVLFNNLLFAMLIVIGAFVLALEATRPPKLVRFEVGNAGITVEKTVYPFHTLSSFWIDQTDQEKPKLLVTSSKIIMPLIVMPLGNINPEAIREILKNRLAEIPQSEPLLQKLMERFGF